MLALESITSTEGGLVVDVNVGGGTVTEKSTSSVSFMIGFATKSIPTAAKDRQLVLITKYTLTGFNNTLLESHLSMGGSC